MPAYLVILVIGLMAGGAIGYLIARLKSASSVADRATDDADLRRAMRYPIAPPAIRPMTRITR